MEIVYVIGVVILGAALVYGTTRYRRRNDPARQAGEKVVEERYKRNDN